MVNEKCVSKYGKELKACTDREIYIVLLELVKELAQEKVSNKGKKKV